MSTLDEDIAHLRFAVLDVPDMGAPLERVIERLRRDGEGDSIAARVRGGEARVMAVFQYQVDQAEYDEKGLDGTVNGCDVCKAVVPLTFVEKALLPAAGREKTDLYLCELCYSGPINPYPEERLRVEEVVNFAANAILLGLVEFDKPHVRKVNIIPTQGD